MFNQDRQFFSGLSFVKNVSTASALPPFSTSFLIGKNLFFTFIYKIYAAFVQFVIWSSILRVILRPFLYKMTVSGVAEFTVALTYISQTFFRGVIIHKKEKIMFNYLQAVSRIENESDLKQLFDIKFKKPKLFGKVLLSGQIIFTILTFVIAPYFLEMGTDNLPMAYLLIDSHYLMRSFYQLLDGFLAFFLIIRSIAIDWLYLTLVIYHVTQQELLKNNLKLILKSIRGEKNEETEKKLKKWFELHKKSLRQVNELKVFLEPLLSVTYMYNLISLVLLIFFVIGVGEMDWGHKVLGTGSITAGFLVLGWLCVLADQLNEQHEQIPQQFKIDHIVENRSLKSKFLILCIRSQRSLKLSALHYFVLSSKNFTEIVSTTFSLFAALWQIQTRILH